MKSAGVSASKVQVHHALGASLAAILLVLLASTPARSGAETAASETWKTEAASAAASASTGAGAPTEEAPAPSPPLTSTERSSDRPTTAGASNLVATAPDLDGAQPGTVEIPPANSADASRQQPPSPALESLPSDESSDVARYREDESEQLESEGELSTTFGMQLREARRTLRSGEEANGLLITAVEKKSPAAAVGLHAYSHGVHDALTGVGIVGALVLFMVPGGQFAILLIPVLGSMQVGESYDMIIGVDGTRVTNFLDFQDSLHDLQPGEVIYLSVVRNGKRVQVTMPVPTNALQATN
jgi:PDZ domain